MSLPNDFLASLTKRIQAIAADGRIIPSVSVHSDFAERFAKALTETNSCDIGDLILFIEGSLAYACAHHNIDYGSRRDCFSRIVSELLGKVDAATRGSIESILSDHSFLARRKVYVDPCRVAGELRLEKERKARLGEEAFFVQSVEPGISGHCTPCT
jgi:hypothetical protein